MGPPNVNSPVGCTSCVRGSPNGLTVRQASSANVARYDPENVLPPDFVTALTRPPENRPYSAEMPDVVMVVACSASSMKSDSGVPRRLS